MRSLRRQAGDAPKPGRPSRTRRWLGNLALFAAASLLGLVLCEVVARAFVDLGTFQYTSADGKTWNSPAPARKYVLTPGFSGRLSAQEFDHRVEINSLGFRGPERTLADEAPTIFVVGDSFVFGVGSEYEDTIPARLEHHLGRATGGGQPTDVWNLGVPGYALQQYLFTLEHYLALRTPKTVIVGLYLGRIPSGANDLTGSVKFERWQERRPEASTPSPHSPAATSQPPLSSRLQRAVERRSALYNLLLLRLGPALRSLAHDRASLDADATRQLERGWRLLDDFLTALRSSSRDAGFESLLVYIPEQPDVLSADRRLARRLRAVAASHGLPLVDGMRWISPSDSSELYYPLDGHLTPIGNELLARILSCALLDPRRGRGPGEDPGPDDCPEPVLESGSGSS